MNAICNDILEAYRNKYDRGDFPDITDEAYEESIVKMIVSHTPKQRLETYLEWNGIIGYTHRIFDIANGKVAVHD